MPTITKTILTDKSRPELGETKIEYDPDKPGMKAIIDALDKKNLADLQTALKSVTNQEDIAAYGNSALKLAICQTDLEAVKILLQQPGVIEMAVAKDYLDLACENNNKEIVELLLQQPDVTEMAVANDYLDFACENNNKAIAELLLQQPDVIEKEVDCGNQNLITACQNDYKEIVELLLQQPAILEEDLNQGCKALVTAIKNNHKEMVKFLLTLPITEAFEKALEEDVNNDLFASACEKGDEYKEMVEILLQHPSVIERVEYNENNALKLAIEDGHLEIVNILLKQPGVIKSLGSLQPLQREIERNSDDLTKVKLPNAFIGSDHDLFSLLEEVIESKDDDMPTPISALTGEIQKYNQKRFLDNNNLIGHLANKGGWSAIATLLESPDFYNHFSPLNAKKNLLLVCESTEDDIKSIAQALDIILPENFMSMAFNTKKSIFSYQIEHGGQPFVSPPLEAARMLRCQHYDTMHRQYQSFEVANRENVAISRHADDDSVVNKAKKTFDLVKTKQQDRFQELGNDDETRAQTMIPVIRGIILEQILANMETRGSLSETDKELQSFIKANFDELKNVETAREETIKTAREYFEHKDGEDVSHAAWRCYDKDAPTHGHYKNLFLPPPNDQANEHTFSTNASIEGGATVGTASSIIREHMAYYALLVTDERLLSEKVRTDMRLDLVTALAECRGSYGPDSHSCFPGQLSRIGLIPSKAPFLKDKHSVSLFDHVDRIMQNLVSRKFIQLLQKIENNENLTKEQKLHALAQSYDAVGAFSSIGGIALNIERGEYQKVGWSSEITSLEQLSNLITLRKQFLNDEDKLGGEDQVIEYVTEELHKEGLVLTAEETSQIHALLADMGRCGGTDLLRDAYHKASKRIEPTPDVNATMAEKPMFPAPDVNKICQNASKMQGLDLSRKKTMAQKSFFNAQYKSDIYTKILELFKEQPQMAEEITNDLNSECNHKREHVLDSINDFIDKTMGPQKNLDTEVIKNIKQAHREVASNIWETLEAKIEAGFSPSGYKQVKVNDSLLDRAQKATAASAETRTQKLSGPTTPNLLDTLLVLDTNTDNINSYLKSAKENKLLSYEFATMSLLALCRQNKNNGKKIGLLLADEEFKNQVDQNITNKMCANCTHPGTIDWMLDKNNIDIGDSNTQKLTALSFKNQNQSQTSLLDITTEQVNDFVQSLSKKDQGLRAEIVVDEIVKLVKTNDKKNNNKNNNLIKSFLGNEQVKSVMPNDLSKQVRDELEKSNHHFTASTNIILTELTVTANKNSKPPARPPKK